VHSRAAHPIRVRGPGTVPGQAGALTVVYPGSAGARKSQRTRSAAPRDDVTTRRRTPPSARRGDRRTKRGRDLLGAAVGADASAAPPRRPECRPGAAPTQSTGRRPGRDSRPRAPLVLACTGPAPRRGRERPPGRRISLAMPPRPASRPGNHPAPAITRHRACAEAPRPSRAGAAGCPVPWRGEGGGGGDGGESNSPSETRDPDPLRACPMLDLDRPAPIGRSGGRPSCVSLDRASLPATRRLPGLHLR
jgi:hypothetical protein